MHIQIVRTHVGKGLGILGTGVFGRLDGDTVEMQQTFVGASVEQVHVTQEAVDKRAGRVVPYLLRRANLLDDALVHQHHAVGHLQRFLLVVRDEDARDMQFVVQAAQPPSQLFADLGVESTERFIQEQHLGLDRQRTRQGDALSLAARELGRKAVSDPVQLHQLEQIGHLLADLRLARPFAARLDAQTEGHVLEHGHVAEQRVVLEHEAHVALTHVHVGGVFSAEQDVAAVRGFQTRDDAQQRGLAAARRAQQGQEFAGVDVEVHVLQRMEAAKVLVDVTDLDAHGLLIVRVRRWPWMALPGSCACAGSRAEVRQWPSSRARGATPPRS